MVLKLPERGTKPFKRWLKSCLILICFGTGLLSDSCNEDIILMEVDCSECYVEKPTEGSLNFKVTINEENPEVPVTVYLGEYEKNQVRYTDTVNVEFFSIDIYPNRFYSARAEYRVGSVTIYAIDGDKTETLKVTSQCETDCWIIQEGEVDLRLKYQDKDKLPQ